MSSYFFHWKKYVLAPNNINNFHTPSKIIQNKLMRPFPSLPSPPFCGQFPQNVSLSEMILPYVEKDSKGGKLGQEEESYHLSQSLTYLWILTKISVC